MFNEKMFYDLSLFSYFDTEELHISVSDCIRRVITDEQLAENYKDNIDFSRNLELLKNVKIEDYEDVMITQFFQDNERTGVVYYLLETNDAFIFAIRGSESLDPVCHKTGWQDWMDNFRMFLKGPSYQQIYTLHQIQQTPIEKPFYLCGHSKGGNLSLFCALTMKEEFFQKLQAVYSFNAPGITKSVLSSYEERAKSDGFLKKIFIFENENDTISAFFENLKEPLFIRSSVPCTNLEQLYRNHNLSAMDFTNNMYVLAEKKTAMPKIAYHFINDFFLNLKEERLQAVVKKMDGYFESGLSLNELYKVIIYDVGRYTSLFEDIDYEEVRTISFEELMERRKTKLLLAKVKELQPKEAIAKMADNIVKSSPLAKLNELDIREVTQGFIDNYELIIKEKVEEFQQAISENNERIVSAIKSINSRENQQ